MRISRFLVAGLLAGATALAAGPLPALALDPQLIEKEKTPFQKQLEKLLPAKKQAEPKDPIAELRYAAEKGDHSAQWRLARMYQIGEGVERNPREAFAFFKQIVDSYTDARPGTPDWQFTAYAMVALGHYYRTGVPEADIAQDPSEAQIMFTTAAHYFGHPEAQFELARIYMQNEQVAGNGIKAARMLKSAADRGHVGAQARLGRMLFEGRYLRRDAARGLAMIMNARERAGAADIDWISELQEEVFADASEEERRAAIELLHSGNLGLVTQSRGLAATALPGNGGLANGGAAQAEGAGLAN